MHTEKIIEETIIYTGKVFTIKEQLVTLENGKNTKREVVIHNGGAGIIPIDNEGNIYLVRQFRIAFESEVLEIPAGKLEKDEDPFFAAKRELKEETGFTSSLFEPLGEIWPTVGFCSEKIYLYLARNLTQGEANLDEDEFVSMVKIPFSKAVEMCLTGEIKDGKTICGIFKAKEFLGL